MGILLLMSRGYLTPLVACGLLQGKDCWTRGVVFMGSFVPKGGLGVVACVTCLENRTSRLCGLCVVQLCANGSGVPDMCMGMHVLE